QVGRADAAQLELFDESSVERLFRDAFGGAEIGQLNCAERQVRSPAVVGLEPADNRGHEDRPGVGRIVQERDFWRVLKLRSEARVERVIAGPFRELWLGDQDGSARSD